MYRKDRVNADWREKRESYGLHEEAGQGARLACNAHGENGELIEGGVLSVVDFLLAHGREGIALNATFGELFLLHLAGWNKIVLGSCL